MLNLTYNPHELHDKTSKECDKKALTYLATKQVDRQYKREQREQAFAMVLCTLVFLYCFVASCYI